VLTVLHPEIRLLVSQFPSGLMPIRLEQEDRLSLIIKTQKEAILAAKSNGGFAFYLPPLPSNRCTTTALITAFFDDEDEPLTIRSPLFGDHDKSVEMLEILTYDSVDIYFFDEHDYEWMSFRTTLTDGGSCLLSDEKIQLLPYHINTARGCLKAMSEWFSQRSTDDDKRAIQAVFTSELSRNDSVVFDMTPSANSYTGSAGFRFDSLNRTDPGYFQEHDIAACLSRAFSAESIIINPRRKDTNKEVLDHLVLTETIAIFIQAKDSPTTESGIGRDLDRKRRATHRQIKAALNQLKGAARFFSREEVAKLVTGGREIDVSIGQRKVLGLAIVKELFDDEGDAYTLASTELSYLNGGGIVMDYFSFHALTFRFRSASKFAEALETIIERTKSGGWFSVKDALLRGILD